MFIEYIDEKICDLKEEEMQLQNTDRKDEANLIKIKINICEICKTLYNVSKKESSEQKAKEFYLQKIENLSFQWKSSMEKAKEFGEVEKTAIEEIKLETLNEIKSKYESFFQ